MNDYVDMEYDGYLQEKACIEITGHPDGDLGTECDFCYHPVWENGFYEVNCDSKQLAIYDYTKDTNPYGAIIEMNYCPKCGRKL